MKTRQHTVQSGFSLIELMVTVAIIGILVAVAMPSYTAHVLRSHRVEARTALTDLAGREEKYFGVYNQYTNDPIALGYAAVGSGATFPLNVGSGYYEIDLPAANVTNVAGAPSTYLLTAVPSTTTTQGTQQATDTQCLTLTLNQLGVQTSAPGPITDCWGR